MSKPLADTMRDCGFQRVVMENVLVDKRRELWLAACDILRLAADACPDRIDLVEGLSRPSLKMGHGILSPGASRSPT
jgi:hypothetical protein